FIANVPDAQRPPPSLVDEFANVSSPQSLALALDTLAVRSIYQKAPPAEQREKIAALEARFASRWSAIGAVGEAFGRACDAAGDRPSAIRWYRQVLAANDGSASLRTVEQLGNLRVREAWSSVERVLRERGGGRAKTRRAAGRGSKSRRSGVDS